MRGRHAARIAIVVPELGAGGGVPSVALFLHDAIERDGRWTADVISLPTSRRDVDSIRIVDPRTWARGCRVSRHTFSGVEYRSVGCIAPELEFQRYMPRPTLTRELKPYALVQAVAGGPAAAFAVLNRARPTVVNIATLARHERASQLERERGLKRAWLTGMTAATSVIERRALAQLDHVFAQSAYTRELVRPYVDESRLSVAPSGVDTELFKPSQPYADDGYIVSVGRFDDARKNVKMLFRAYAHLRGIVHAPPKLVLAGKSGPSEADRRLAHDLGLDGTWECRVDLSFEELAHVYRGGSVFALASDEEGLGIVVQEAMASGLPVVATRCGGPDMLVTEGETGHLVPVGDHVALATRLAELLEDAPRRRRMAVASREQADRKYSLTASARTYFDVYEKLLERTST